jgi:uncharacterized protein
MTLRRKKSMGPMTMKCRTLVFAVPVYVAAATLAAIGVLDAGAAPNTAGDHKIKIAFAGDSIVDNYWSGAEKVVAADTCLSGMIELGRFAKNGTGLARGDRLYWPREIHRIVETFEPNIVVLSIGLNDNQFIVDENGAHTAWGAPEWTDKYRAEITAFLRGASSDHAAVLLVGLPVVRNAEENAELKKKNAMYEAAVAALGNPDVIYVEPWRLDPAAAVDTFSSFGRDKKGRMVQLRTGDGEHFTDAGEDVVAQYLFPKIVEAANRKGARLDRCLSPQAGTQ